MRVGLGRVAGRLVGLERPDQDHQLVERRHALPADRRMSGPSRHLEPEGDRAGMGDDDVEIGRLGDDRHLAGDPGPDRRQHALAAVLLGRHEGRHDLAVERSRRPTRRASGGRKDRSAPPFITGTRP
jgi:hypothetical protein